LKGLATSGKKRNTAIGELWWGARLERANTAGAKRDGASMFIVNERGIKTNTKSFWKIS